ncbi:MAG: hypothetical protein GY790_13825 [Bacteroidetes bacterium]|nr:hypothetical protein [Bacteroidota bacterium]
MKATNRKSKFFLSLLICVYCMLGCVFVTQASGKTYYVSQSLGSDNNDGQSVATAWKTLARASQEYQAGDSLLLKCGDTWFDDTLSPKGSGTPKNPIIIASYGSGNKPILDGLDDHQNRIGIHLLDVEGYRILGLEITRYRSGIFAHYSADKKPKKYLWIEDCYIHDATYYSGYHDFLKERPSLGISLWTDETDQVLVMTDITIKNCRFERLLSAIWTNNPDNWNQKADGKYSFGNLVIDGCIAEEGKQWQIGLRGINGGAVRNCVFHDTGRRFKAFNGVAGAMIQRCQNMVFENSEWGFVSIGEPGQVSIDGQSFDFELDCYKLLVRNCLFHDTEGPGFLSCYGASGPTHNREIVMENCVLNGKATRVKENLFPYVEIYNVASRSQIDWKNCRFYLSWGEELTNDIGQMTFTDCLIKKQEHACSTRNLALDAKVKSSSSLMASGPEKANDGLINTSWIPAEPTGAWLEIDFGEPRTVNEFMIREHPNSTITRFTIEYWDLDRKGWFSCFNGGRIPGRTILKDNDRSKMGFLAPIVARTTNKVRLVVSRTETDRCRIDEFEAYNDTTPSLPGTKGVFNDNHKQIVYSNWITTRSAGYIGGDRSMSNVKGANCEFTFVGTGITWIGIKNNLHGKADVYIDNVLQATVDTHNPVHLPQQELFTKTGLKPGKHTIKIVVKGNKNPTIWKGRISIDAFKVHSKND